MFYVGQKVVCINTFFIMKKAHPEFNFPEKGAIYTVRDIEGDSFIRLNEVVNPKQHFNTGFLEPNWSCRSFAPLQTDTEVSETTSENWIERTLPQPVEA